MQEWIIITGGGRGVGHQVLLNLLSKNYNVINISRTKSKIEHPQLIEIECDLSQKEYVSVAMQDLTSIFNSKNSKSTISYLILNAAYAYYGETLAMDAQKIESMVYTNYLGPISLIKNLYPYFSSHIKIIYVSSSASRIPAPKFTYYVSTKLALESFIQSICMEKKWRFSILRPAEIDTEFAKRSAVPEEVDAGVKKLSAQEVASRVIQAMNFNKIFINVGLRAKIIDLIIRICPEFLLKRR